jgi:hypothetical protein
MTDRELDLLVHDLEVENTGLKDRIQDLYGQLNATEKEVDDCRLVLRQVADMLATLPVKHPDQIAPRDALVKEIKERIG